MNKTSSTTKHTSHYSTEAFYKIGKDLIQKTDQTFLTCILFEYYKYYAKEYFCSEKKHPFPSVKVKYLLLTYVMTNIFMGEKATNDFLDFFCQVQRVYNAFSKIAHVYKVKKAPCKIDTDLYLNPISRKDKNVMVIYQDNHTFLFCISDLIKIIKDSICHSEMFFSKPLPCKNPYNNSCFTKANLYNIYFFIKFRNYIMPDFVQYYFLNGFDLFLFQKEHDFLIKEYTIKNYMESSTLEMLYKYTIQMLQFYNNIYKRSKINIHDEFPRMKLVDIMMPYLKIYFVYRFCVHQDQSEYKRCELYYKLNEFQKYNPRFGRKYQKVTNVFYNKKEYSETFDEHHISFYKQQKYFPDSHTRLIERNHPRWFLSENTDETRNRFIDEEEEVFVEDAIPDTEALREEAVRDQAEQDQAEQDQAEGDHYEDQYQEARDQEEREVELVEGDEEERAQMIWEEEEYTHSHVSITNTSFIVGQTNNLIATLEQETNYFLEDIMEIRRETDQINQTLDDLDAMLELHTRSDGAESIT